MRFAPGLALAALIGTAASAHAQMQVDCFAEVDCRHIVAESISPTILGKFPGNRYKVVVFASNHDFPEGGGAAYAVVGLSERVVVRGVDITALPLQRFSASQPFSDRGDAAAGTDARRSGPVADALRAALGEMNRRCASTADCPVFTAYR